MEQLRDIIVVRFPLIASFIGGCENIFPRQTLKKTNLVTESLQSFLTGEKDNKQRFLGYFVKSKSLSL